MFLYEIDCVKALLVSKLHNLSSYLCSQTKKNIKKFSYFAVPSMTHSIVTKQCVKIRSEKKNYFFPKSSWCYDRMNIIYTVPTVSLYSKLKMTNEWKKKQILFDPPINPTIFVTFHVLCKANIFHFAQGVRSGPPFEK